jgi:xanthine dehydrogenase accessory factor
MRVWATIENEIKHGARVALVSVVATRGSAPRGKDAHMIVTDHGFHGTIGGGALEWRAMADARVLLGRATSAATTFASSHALGPALGQCCGGHVSLFTEVFGPDRRADVAACVQHEGREFVLNTHGVERCFGVAQQRVMIFGAGHVGKALVLTLAQLDCDVMWIDTRPSAFPQVVPSNVSLFQPDDPLSLLAGMSDGSFVFVMTHSHALDLAVCDAALRHPRAAHVGVIGSATKRARFEKRLTDAGIDVARVQSLICPIGVRGISSKHPSAIAISVAAQILQLRDLSLQVEIGTQRFASS